MYNTTTPDGKLAAFDNDLPDAAEQLRLLSETFDPHTNAVLTGLGVAESWYCWDIGSGGGSTAAWLADRVGKHGRVLATDLKPHHVSATRTIEVRQHDLTNDDLPSEKFDLIHARLVLMHLKDREELVSRLATVLKPGGALVLTDWYAHSEDEDLVQAAPDEASRLLFLRFQEASRIVAARKGSDFFWAQRTPQIMRAAGLTDITIHEHREVWPGGSPGARLLRIHPALLREPLLASGVLTNEDLESIRELLLDPRLVVSPCQTLTTTGRV